MSNWERKVRRAQERRLIKEFQKEAQVSKPELDRYICEDNNIKKVKSQKARLAGMFKLAMENTIERKRKEAEEAANPVVDEAQEQIAAKHNQIEDAIIIEGNNG